MEGWFGSFYVSSAKLNRFLLPTTQPYSLDNPVNPGGNISVWQPLSTYLIPSLRRLYDLKHSHICSTRISDPQNLQSIHPCAHDSLCPPGRERNVSVITALAGMTVSRAALGPACLTFAHAQYNTHRKLRRETRFDD